MHYVTYWENTSSILWNEFNVINLIHLEIRGDFTMFSNARAINSPGGSFSSSLIQEMYCDETN